MWQAFAAHVDAAPDPLNRWTREIVEPIAEKSEARAVYPFASAVPFQRWAQRSESVYCSPLGILIHPHYGLWHAYRAALLFKARLRLPPHERVAHPCESCAEKPCLTACPVGAFNGRSYDVAACAAHLGSRDAEDRPAACLTLGCLARNACPVGREFRYPEAQVEFHMAAFAGSVRATSAPPHPATSES